MTRVGSMKAADRLDGVGQSQRRGLLKEFADGQVVRSPHGSGRLLSQRLVEEQAGALAGKHHRDATEVGAEALKQRGGYMFKERFHRASEIKG